MLIDECQKVCFKNTEKNMAVSRRESIMSCAANWGECNCSGNSRSCSCNLQHLELLHLHCYCGKFVGLLHFWPLCLLMKFVGRHAAERNIMHTPCWPKVLQILYCPCPCPYFPFLLRDMDIARSLDTFSLQYMRVCVW